MLPFGKGSYDTPMVPAFPAPFLGLNGYTHAVLADRKGSYNNLKI